jgi:hypothetical protein
MVLLPGCVCCPPPCSRPCPSIRYVAIRFQVAAASGNPIASSLPLTVPSTYPGGSSRSWTPPGVLSSVSSPEIDETLVVDLWQAPGFSVVGTYGRIDVTSLDDFFNPCKVSYSFSHKLVLGTWPRFRNDGGGVVGLTRNLLETVDVQNQLFPWGMWDSSDFLYRDQIAWDAGLVIDPRKTRTITKQPPTFRECSGPGGWNIASDVSTGTAPSVGGSYVRPEPNGAFGQYLTNVVPYYDPGPSYYPYYGAPYYEVGEGFASTLEWRRILPDPVVTITVS